MSIKTETSLSERLNTPHARDRSVLTGKGSSSRRCRTNPCSTTKRGALQRAITELSATPHATDSRAASSSIRSDGPFWDSSSEMIDAMPAYSGSPHARKPHFDRSIRTNSSRDESTALRDRIPTSGPRSASSSSGLRGACRNRISDRTRPPIVRGHSITLRRRSRIPDLWVSHAAKIRGRNPASHITSRAVSNPIEPTLLASCMSRTSAASSFSASVTSQPWASLYGPASRRITARTMSASTCDRSWPAESNASVGSSPNGIATPATRRTLWTLQSTGSHALVRGSRSRSSIKRPSTCRIRSRDTPNSEAMSWSVLAPENTRVRDDRMTCRLLSSDRYQSRIAARGSEAFDVAILERTAPCHSRARSGGSPSDSRVASSNSATVLIPPSVLAHRHSCSKDLCTSSGTFDTGSSCGSCLFSSRALVDLFGASPAGAASVPSGDATPAASATHISSNSEVIPKFGMARRSSTDTWPVRCRNPLLTKAFVVRTLSGPKSSARSISAGMTTRDEGGGLVFAMCSNERRIGSSIGCNLPFQNVERSPILFTAGLPARIFRDTGTLGRLSRYQRGSSGVGGLPHGATSRRACPESISWGMWFTGHRRCKGLYRHPLQGHRREPR